MLAIFNLDWGRFSISQQVKEANYFMEGLAREVGLAGRIIFNCASMGTGEHLLPFGDEQIGKMFRPMPSTICAGSIIMFGKPCGKTGITA